METDATDKEPSELSPLAVHAIAFHGPLFIVLAASVAILLFREPFSITTLLWTPFVLLVVHFLAEAGRDLAIRGLKNDIFRCTVRGLPALHGLLTVVILAGGMLALLQFADFRSPAVLVAVLAACLALPLLARFLMRLTLPQQEQALEVRPPSPVLRTPVIVAEIAVILTLSLAGAAMTLLELASALIASTAVVATSIFAVLTFYTIGMARERGFLAREQYRVCLRCTYILSGLPPQGRCPECGSEYTFQELEGHWRRYLDPPRD